MHQLMAETLDEVIDEIRAIQDERARARLHATRPRWPMIVLQTPKGWTGPKVVDGLPIEGTFRAHQVPLVGSCARSPQHLQCSNSGCAAIGPRNCSTHSGSLRAELAELAPKGERRMGANPHANGGILLRDLRMPDFRDYAVDVPEPGAVRRRRHPRARTLPARRHQAQRRSRATSASSARTRRSPTGWTPSSRRPSGSGTREIVPIRRSPRARGPRDGGAERAPVPGLARRLPAHRRHGLFNSLRGVHPHHRLDVQPARQVAEGDAPDPLAAADRLAQLSAELARLAAGSQRLHPSGPGLHRSRRDNKKAEVDPRLSAARCELPALGGGPLPAQPQLRQRHRRRQAAGAAVARHGRGASSTARPGSASGSGRATIAAASPTSSWPARATCRRSRRWPR